MGECRMREANSILFPPFRLEILNEKLWCGRDAIPLRQKTFAILRYLAEHAGRLVSKTELLHAIWGETQINAEGLRDYIREIRQALQDDSVSPRFVETVHGRGYRFVASSQDSVASREETQDQATAIVRERGHPTQASPLLIIRGICDGKTFRTLPTESLPSVSREVAVVILFLEEGQTKSFAGENALLSAGEDFSQTDITAVPRNGSV
jgi:DNA-binding winged helix-turn-helix (wHTH) protein